MEITEVRIKLMDDPNDRLQGFCSITFDGCFVIRDLKIIQGTKVVCGDAEPQADGSLSAVRHEEPPQGSFLQRLRRGTR